MKDVRISAPVALLLSLMAAPAFAAESVMDKADVAWMLVATTLVLFMTIPGIALFYGGMSRKKNVLSVLAQTTVICCALTIVWFAVGYSLAFTPGNPWIGNFSQAFLSGIDIHSMTGSIPTLLFVIFQMTFAVLTAALMIGSFVGRMKFSAMLVFMILWSVCVYAPICHWVWCEGGFFFDMGALDYAGGTVVHINAGIAGLVGCLILGKRLGYGREPMSPNNLTFAMIGACILWIGWFGFNGGSGLAANERAVMAILVTQIAAAAAGVAWMACEWIIRGKPSLLGLISGAVGGLVVITPASGFVGPMPALVMGLIGGAVCFWGATVLKRMMGWDDSLDAFGVHGVGGIVGALLTGVFASSAITGAPTLDIGTQLGIQALSVVATIVFSGGMTWLLMTLVDKVIGIRVTTDEERMGLDLALHGERIE
ncbi:MAG: ammonium transporter [Sutterellaceae bacterium]|nr:ammonium transporter [Sutterellaceae bacterium]